MGEIVPGVAVIAVVFADRTPLPLAEVGAPFLPGNVRLARVVQPLLLGDIHHWGHVVPPLCGQMTGPTLAGRGNALLWDQGPRPDGPRAPGGGVPSVHDVDAPADLLDDREAAGLELLLSLGRQGPGDPEREAAVIGAAARLARRRRRELRRARRQRALRPAMRRARPGSPA